MRATMADGTAPFFGEPVDVVARLRRRTAAGKRKVWDREERAGGGIIIGERTLSNGAWTYEDWGIEYTPSERFRAFLVATDMSTKPFFALPEDVHPQVGGAQ